ncbi:phosphopantetheine-binding protein [Streptomyces sp. NPDC004629]|uniref:phosphopantetheine-binding protein n=1 Tax=Streptomyces sp. NPDC004629 TaxID=3364705 RepID=UPI0036A3BE7C
MSEATRETAARTMTPTESTLAQMWRDLLDRPDVGTQDDFFEAGGTSLTAIKFLQRVEKAFGPDVLTPDQVYEHPQLHSLARAIDEATGRR